MGRRTPVNRIAYVRYAPKGREYVARCPREDIGPGDHVEVLARDSEWRDGQVVSITHQRWACGDAVVNLASEVRMELVNDPVEGLYVERIVQPARPTLRLVTSRP